MSLTNTPLRYPYVVHINALHFVVVKLNTTNFMNRESQIINLIKSQHCLGWFLDGSIPSPPPNVTTTLSNSSE